jgi:hypothetical protein
MSVMWPGGWLGYRIRPDMIFLKLCLVFDDLRCFSGVSVPDKITIVRVIYPLCAKLIHCWCYPLLLDTALLDPSSSTNSMKVTTLSIPFILL